MGGVARTAEGAVRLEERRRFFCDAVGAGVTAGFTSTSAVLSAAASAAFPAPSCSRSRLPGPRPSRTHEQFVHLALHAIAIVERPLLKGGKDVTKEAFQREG